MYNTRTLHNEANYRAEKLCNRMLNTIEVDGGCRVMAARLASTRANGHLAWDLAPDTLTFYLSSPSLSHPCLSPFSLSPLPEHAVL